MPWRQAVIIFCLVTPAIASAELYTWVDSTGVSHFSDKKPDIHDHEKVELGNPLLIPMEENITRVQRVINVPQQSKSSREVSSANQSALREKKKTRERQRKKARCDGYRKKLERIHQQLRAGYSNDKGNRLRRQRREVSQKLSRECLLG